MTQTVNAPDLPQTILAAIAPYPPEARLRFTSIRQAIFEEAERLQVGPLEETLKWGEPAYLTPVSKAGSTIRLAWSAKTPQNCNLYFNCKTDILDRFKSEFPDTFETSSNRSIHIPLTGDIAELPMRAAIAMALTYHRDRLRR